MLSHAALNGGTGSGNQLAGASTFQSCATSEVADTTFADTSAGTVSQIPPEVTGWEALWPAVAIIISTEYKWRQPRPAKAGRPVYVQKYLLLKTARRGPHQQCAG